VRSDGISIKLCKCVSLNNIIKRAKFHRCNITGFGAVRSDNVHITMGKSLTLLYTTARTFERYFLNYSTSCLSGNIHQHRIPGSRQPDGLLYRQFRALPRYSARSPGRRSTVSFEHYLGILRDLRADGLLLDPDMHLMELIGTKSILFDLRDSALGISGILYHKLADMKDRPDAEFDRALPPNGSPRYLHLNQAGL